MTIILKGLKLTVLIIRMTKNIIHPILSDLEIANITKQFKTMRKFKIHHEDLWVFIKKNKLSEKYCSHMKMHPKYTENELFELAKKYKQRSHFLKENPSAYQIARKRGILDKICDHMGRKKNQAYCIDELNKIALLCKSRSDFERRYKNEYHSVIGRNLGHIVFKNLPSLKKDPYTKEELEKIFSSCYCLTELYKKFGRKIAIAAQRKGLFEDFKLLFKKGVPDEYSSWSQIKDLIKQYNSLKSFKRDEYLAYLSAERLNLMENLTQTFRIKKLKRHPDNKPYYKEYTIDELILLCLKYKTPKDFKNNEEQAYLYAKKKQVLLKVLSKTMIFPKSDKSLQDLFDSSKKYSTIGEFLKFQRHSYFLAKEYGILDDVCSHFNRLVREKHSDEELITFARKHKHKDDVRIESSGAYSAIMKRGLADIAFAHMSPKKFGKMEDEVRKFVSKYYNCKKYRDCKVNITGKSHIKSFEIDILIPLLNKGIEFDGDYWHSFEVLKVRRPSWSDDDLLNYEKIKDDYFKTKGIEILHIKEKDWLKNPSKCKKQILSFLRE